eukprot:1466619-Rhodomonas_salina.1
MLVVVLLLQYLAALCWGEEPRKGGCFGPIFGDPGSAACFGTARGSNSGFQARYSDDADFGFQILGLVLQISSLRHGFQSRVHCFDHHIIILSSSSSWPSSYHHYYHNLHHSSSS